MVCWNFSIQNAMISENYSNLVYFSSLLPERCPKTFGGLKEVLDRYGVEYRLLDGTNDIWCRDYMPIQVMPHGFELFRYNPDYLQDTDGHRASITDNLEVSRHTAATHISDQRGIVLDGGNVVHDGSKVIMTTKVFEENPWWKVRDLARHLEYAFGADIIFLPWDSSEIYGHTDGILRIIGPDTVLLTNYAQFDSKMAARFKRCLKPHFKRVKELRYKVKQLSKDSWAYINWLQTDKVLILPKFNIPEDKLALNQIERLMPDYKGRIEMVDATDLIKYEGCLNCASWTIFDGPKYSEMNSNYGV